MICKRAIVGLESDYKKKKTCKKRLALFLSFCSYSFYNEPVPVTHDFEGFGGFWFVNVTKRTKEFSQEL